MTDKIEVFYLPVFNPDNPTDPKNYVARGNGLVEGTPLYWDDDITGKTQAAIMAYLMREASPDQLKIVIAYIQHHIHAPCWLEKHPFGADSDYAEIIGGLREQSKTLATVEDIEQYINDTLEWGLDPL